MTQAALASQPSTATGESSAIGAGLDTTEAADEKAVAAEESQPDAPSELPLAALPVAVREAIEVLLPQAAPLTGAVALDLAAVEAGAAELLSTLSGADATGSDSWSDPERWAWASAAVLVGGALTYGIGSRRARLPADRVTLGTDSVLARLEKNNARRPA